MNTVLVCQEYVINKLSTSEIARKYNSHPTTINRILRQNGVKIRSKMESHQIHIEKNGEEFKNKMSDVMAQKWASRTDKEIKKISKKAQKNWNKLPKEKIDEIKTKSSKAIRKAAEEGSKAEKVIQNYLVKQGITVEHHKKFLTNENLEVDLFLPARGTIIEVNGPSHYRPVWGEEKLQAQQKADTEKFGLIIRLGYILIKVKLPYNRTERQLRHVAEKVYQAVLKGQSVEVE